MRTGCLLGLVAALALLAPVGVARGQSEDELVKARRLFSQGLTQEVAGDWAGALASFEEVARIKLTPQVRFHVARSKEHLGRFNEALGGYRLAEYEASQGTAKEQEILPEVQKARESLEQRIPKLTIERGARAAAIKVELDGVMLGDRQVGKEITVDPGPHVVTGIVRPGKRFKLEVTLGEGESQKLVLDVPEDLLEPEPAPAPSASVGGDQPPPSPPPAAEKKGHGAAPWIVAGVGVASLAVSGVYYAKRNDAVNELEAGCLGRTCPDTLRNTQSKGETYSIVSGVTLGIGIAALGASALMLLGGSSSSADSAPAAALGVAPRRVDLSYRGRF